MVCRELCEASDRDDCDKFDDFIWIQFGITSYGPEFCGNKDTPGIYTNIAYYKDWIDEQIGRNVGTTPGTGTTRTTTVQTTETSIPTTILSTETPTPITCPSVETPTPVTCPTVETPAPITCPTVETPTSVTCTCPSVETSKPTVTRTTSVSETTKKPDDSQVYPPWYVPKDKEYVTQCCRTVNVSTSQISRAVVKGISKVANFYSIYQSINSFVHFRGSRNLCL